MKDALAFFFSIVEPEIIKVHPSYISPTVEEFVYELKKLNRDLAAEMAMGKMKGKATTRKQTRPAALTRQSGGVLNEHIQWLLERTVGGLIGRFDTTCAKLLSFISTTLWAMWGYKIASDNVSPLPGADTAVMMSDPAGTINRTTCSFLREHIDSLNTLGSVFDESLYSLNAHVNGIYEENPAFHTRLYVLAASNIMPILKTLLNMPTYKLFIVAPISCLLERLGVESCQRECREATYRA
jgi:hypothetical protein